MHNLLEEGVLPKFITKCIINEIGKEQNPLTIYDIIKRNIPDIYFEKSLIESSIQASGPREIILSEYLIKKE